MKLTDLKKVDCGFFPTPLHKLNNLSKELGCNIFMKRDDLTGMGANGNKIRKLEYLVRDALDQGCTTLMTFGGPQTNHGRQTAAVAKKFGMRCIIVATMEESGPNEKLSGNLLLDAILDAEVIFLDTSSIDKTPGRSPDDIKADTLQLRRKVADQIIAECAEKGEKVYEMPAGGSTEIGCMGYFFAVKEILDQLHEMNQPIDYLICPSGSNGTYAGLGLGAHYYKAPFQVIGSCVSPHDPVYVEKMAEYINRASAQFELGVTAKAEDIHMLCKEYAGPAYDTPDPVTFETIYRLARSEGLFVDPCYTGKGFTAVIKEIENGNIPQGSNVLFVHTGGLPGLYSQQHLEKFSKDLWEGRPHRIMG